MKKYIYIIANIVLVSMFTSCEDDLNQIPLSQGTTENFYSTQNDFEQALNATYSIAFHGSGTYGYGNRVLNLSETRSDNYYATTQASRDWEGINNFFTSLSSNGLVREAYVSNYNAIYKANQFIEQIALKGNEVIPVDAERTAMEAEAHFLRAFCYFDLLRWYGRVPLIDKTLSPQEVATVERTAVTEVYNLIISDLEFAVANLPEPDAIAAADYGRVSKYGAKGILALVYMTRSSADYGIQGSTLGLDEWSKAYQQLNDIKASGKYAFSDNYEAIFRVEGSSNKENVLVVPYTQNTGNGVGSNFMVELGYEPYFASLGLSQQGSLEYRPISSSFLSTFDETDERRNFGIVEDFTVASGTLAGDYFDRPTSIKYIDVSRYGNGREDWGVDFIVMRYTDVLMLMAECTLHGGGGSQADVDDIVNDVRERAGLARDASNITLDQLFAERRKEFFGEGTRWFDLIRSGNAVTTMNAWKNLEDTSNSIGTINENSLLYPIPLQEMLAAPDLYDQNPGYDN
ncbi:RagB/SusD family nutrient uptake outer membrane protein [Aestuariibaculum sp. M13]|uniref:RagB/SusD family nutrient uptake outer membrane protein n=1 Tax=Aestuariibaculum sp. M13 TaxID=2967132 RepID=UPI002159C9B7|nr:RagB/SusD family nutrient uptake outer membrane protein [Aestuariibaculum sp. M13]MCR8666818.1 RagB/SusD family nutrient uptake outer membrane protein [Aestuariibaculum sp. M13]